jgi:hypothetical protein
MYLSPSDDNPTCNSNNVSFVNNIDKNLSMETTKQVYLNKI